MATKAKSKTSKKTKSRKTAGVKAPRGAKGKTTGLTVSRMWLAMFRDNAKLAKAQRKTDEQLLAYLQREFPNRESGLFCVRGIRAVRAAFNRGGVPGQDGTAPATKSHAYDKTGDIIAIRRGRVAADKPTPAATAKSDQAKATARDASKKKPAKRKGVRVRKS